MSLKEKPKRPGLELAIRWKNIDYEINSKKKKKLLDNVNGEINNLELVSIFGPPNSGKKTLLNIIAGKIKNYKGKLYYYSRDEKITISFVPQFDELPKKSTIKESLLFASKVKNPSQTNHNKEVEFVLNEFNLWNVRSNYISNCTDSERKRLSIALEMISSPKILIIDEPSDLNSTTFYSVMKLVKSINRNTLIIVNTHHPNSNLFQLFDRCFVLSFGKCIYNGPPSQLADHLKETFNVDCPKYMNPGDIILNIALDINSLHGLGLVDRMTAHELQKATIKSIQNQPDEKQSITFFRDSNGYELKEIVNPSFAYENDSLKECWEIFKRMLFNHIREPQRWILQILINFLFIVILSFFIQRPIGSTEKACLFLKLNQTHIYDEEPFNRFNRLLDSKQDASMIFVNMMFVFYSSFIATVLVMSSQLKLFKLQYSNSYYTIGAYFTATLMINTLLDLIFAFSNSTSFFLFSEHVYNPQKFALFWLIMFLLTNMAGVYGFLLSIIFSDIRSALCVGGFLGLIIQLLSSFFANMDIKFTNSMGDFVKEFSNHIFNSNLYEGILKTLGYFSECKIENYMIFDFDSIYDFIKFYNQVNDNKLDLIGEMPTKTHDALKAALWNRTSITEFIDSMNHLDEQKMEKLNEFWDHKTNYQLQSLKSFDPYITENIFVSLISMIVLTLICFSVLIFKTKK